MKLFLDYLNKIKFHILLMIFPTIFTGIIFFLYQLSPEPVLYVALLWLLAGLTACMTGFSNYRKKLQQLTLIATARISICPAWIHHLIRLNLFSRISCIV